MSSATRTLDPSKLTGPEGSAVAKSTIHVGVQDLPGTFRPATAKASVSGTAQRNASTDAPGIPVASAEASFSLEVTVVGPTPATVDVQMSASNSDENDCTEVVADLDGRSARKAAGGDCGASPLPTALRFTGVTSGSELEVDLSGTVDPEKKGTTEHFAGSFTATVSIPFGACDVVGRPIPRR